MKPTKWMNGFLCLALLAALSGCGGGNASTGTTMPQSGSVFVTGTDAPLPTVVSFQVDITGLSVSDGVNPPVAVLTNTQTVDFARLNGLRTLLDINTIPTGRYTQAIVTLSSPVIGYLNVPNPQTNPPTRPTLSMLDSSASSNPRLNLTQSQVTINLANPLVVTSGDVIGLRFEFDIRKSVALDGSGQITGAITPTLDLKAITPEDADAYVDEFDAGVVSVNAAGNSFVIQGPKGHQFTVNVNQQTEWEGNETINNLTTSSIVEISGTLDRTSATFLADSVAIVSQDKFWAGGLVTFVEPPTGTATDFDTFVRNVLPSGTGFNSGQISTINLAGNETFLIHWWHDNFGSFLFSSSELVAGQHISIAGPFSNGQVTVKRVFSGPVMVQVTPFTHFSGGLSGIGDLTGTTALNLRVVGLVLKNPNNGQPIFLARGVEELTN